MDTSLSFRGSLDYVHFSMHLVVLVTNVNAQDYVGAGYVEISGCISVFIFLSSESCNSNSATMFVHIGSPVPCDWYLKITRHRLADFLVKSGQIEPNVGAKASLIKYKLLICTVSQNKSLLFAMCKSTIYRNVLNIEDSTL